MNILNFFRKPYFSVLCAFSILSISCSQYDTDEPERSFDYSLKNYTLSESYKLDTVFENIDINKKSSLDELSKDLLQEINNQLSTSVVLPEVAHNIFNLNRDEILNIALSEGWVSQKEIDLNEELFDDYKINGFDVAIENYKNRILSMNLTDIEFERQNKFINMIEGFEEFDLAIIDSMNLDVVSEKGPWACAGAVFALTVATANLGSCATIIACGAAILLHVIALDGVARKCKEYL